MIAFIIIIIIIFFIFFYLSKKKKIVSDKIIKSNYAISKDLGKKKEDFELNERKEVILFDDEGFKYKEIIKTKEIPRKTYLLGTLHGKYWGELDVAKGEKYEHFKFYNFNIYEAELKTKQTKEECFCLTANKNICDGFHTESEGIFNFTPDTTFPKGKLPAAIPCLISIKGKTGEYSIVIHEPKVRDVKFDRKLHQDEGKEIFGTIEAEITGYILDFTREEFIDKEFITDNTGLNLPNKTIRESKITETFDPTGNAEYKDGYQKTEYYYSDYKTKYWDNWKYQTPIKKTSTEGCLSSGLGIIGLLIGIICLLLLLPRLPILLPILLVALLFRVIPSGALTWIFRFVGGTLLIAFIATIFNSINRSSTYDPKPFAQDNPTEKKPQYNPIIDTFNNKNIPDTLITHFRSWQDYVGNKYEGRFWIRKSSLADAQYYKNNLSLNINSESNYDEIIYRLKENDKNNLHGVYQLFDSIKISSNLSRMGFAEMIVSFVQDIPYSVVLPSACDPSLYADDFIKNYLSSPDARCDEFEKFGINTPVEFMATLQGDCDTRTLLLYTFLSHYGYDVTLLSSEYYKHSIIGINLPYDGVSFKYNTQRYVLWETTAQNIKPGIIPNELSNTNYWRISLKSK